MKDLIEAVGIKPCIVVKIFKSWVKDKEARRSQKTRKTTAKMGGVCEKGPEKGRQAK